MFFCPQEAQSGNPVGLELNRRHCFVHTFSQEYFQCCPLAVRHVGNFLLQSWWL